MKLLITIDTEEDDAWSGRPAVTTENVTHIPRFQALASRFGWKPTWLCTEPVLRDPRLAEGLASAVSRGEAEIGAHLHPWNCPPFPDGRLPDQSEQFYATEIPPAEFRAKMERVVDATERAFGLRPVSYRAGRWGFDGRQIEHLLALGIRVDCSVTPHISWRAQRGKRDGHGGPDFRGAARVPYWIDPADVRRPGSSQLLELPMTVLYSGGPLAHLPPVWRWADGVRYSPAGKVLNRLGWTARPFRAKHDTALRELLSMVRNARRLGLPYVMLMFHSSELMPGGSPYNPDPAAIERLYRLFESLFASLADDRLEGATLTEFAQPYLAGQAEAARGAP
ncbi:MAG: deacetylase [Candidatus Eisenbacteria bacterium]